MSKNELKENIDYWIKEINKKLIELQENIEHNYELIYDLNDEIDEIKYDLRIVKLMQIYENVQFNPT